MTQKTILLMLSGIFAATVASANTGATPTYDPVESFSPEQVKLIKAAYHEAWIIQD